ncbi:hypothetical protein DM01DRAFT_1379693 [Hesseltinella vesiculosa]|uniref:Uncharacterized protein n=1 Tax=Hesseltinella vesiculosa TaxID=101127 RepID=A0A1X2GYK8_9FUNG|nr:hypothetical protein DM01DRAFT_1379693 [Hesseltinella vesiculosa]
MVSKKKRTAHRSMDDDQRQQFLRDMDHTRDQLMRFKTEMDGLAMQMNDMSQNLYASKDRVCAIEKDILTTQEDNVNLQVLLERAVKRQKETDQIATQRLRHLHTNLSLIAHDNNKLQHRITSLEHLQKEHDGSVYDMVSRIQEYMTMLDNAQDTLYTMKHPSAPIETLTVSLQDLAMFDSRRTSAATHHSTLSSTSTVVAEDATFSPPKPPPTPVVKPVLTSAAHPQIVHKRASFPTRLPASPPPDLRAHDRNPSSSSTSSQASGLLLLLE